MTTDISGQSQNGPNRKQPHKSNNPSSNNSLSDNFFIFRLRSDHEKLIQKSSDVEITNPQARSDNYKWARANRTLLTKSCMNF